MHDSKIDILLINETKLHSTAHDNEVYIPGFFCSDAGTPRKFHQDALMFAKRP